LDQDYILVRVEGIFPGLLRMTIPEWRADVPVYVLRRSLPPDVDAKLLRGGYLFVDADLGAETAEELVVSLSDWEWGRLLAPASGAQPHSQRSSRKRKTLSQI
jgi:hypothetical protein